MRIVIGPGGKNRLGRQTARVNGWTYYPGVDQWGKGDILICYGWQGENGRSESKPRYLRRASTNQVIPGKRYLTLIDAVIDAEEIIASKTLAGRET